MLASVTIAPRKIDSIRASRDGHEFHETWAARLALRLLMPTDDFVGIALEGLSPIDQKGASEESVQIADATLYYGKGPHFGRANRIVVVQVKYSVGKEATPFRAADAKKTIEKFAATYLNFKSRFEVWQVNKKLDFELITNRKIATVFQEALHGIANGTPLKGDAKSQANQIKSASGLAGKELSTFAKKIRLTGMAGNLRQNNRLLSGVIVNWSATHDALARARLGDLRHLLRKKAGLEGEGQNIIRRVDVLECLGLSGADELLPCESAFPLIGPIVPRAQLASTLLQIPELTKPLLIHAAGGVGKTVFLQSLAAALDSQHEVVLFDCFGGGGYRAPEDSRHLPKRGLLHIINSLACKGYCDPLLPSNDDPEALMRAFRHRITQVVEMLKQVRPKAELLLFIDAIDNAADQAKDKKQPSFPMLILESLHHKGLIGGVKLIVSCRTHRRETSRGDIPCEEIQLLPFSKEETTKYLQTRINRITNSQIQVAFSRSGGNPRILEHLALSDRGLLERSELEKPLKLDTLLADRIGSALKEATRRGYGKPNIDAFLAGLAVLPPPVPIVEYANAHGIDIAAVESFAADLAPLLERTKHGLTFRDEPTETFVKENYAANKSTLKKLVRNLSDNQGSSVYAASSLPGLLSKLDDSAALFHLAFDNRFPKAISTNIGQQHIRHNRLTAAVLLAARKGEKGRLVQLLVELSTLAAINQRGTDYILDNPDLVVASSDVDATRRLFETRTAWPGTRHTRLAIVHALSGDVGEATRHARSAAEWMDHHSKLDDNTRHQKRGPELLDRAAIALCIAAQNRAGDATRYIGQNYDWVAFEIGQHLFGFLTQAASMQTIPRFCLDRIVLAMSSQIGGIAAAIASLELDIRVTERLIRKLASACNKSKELKIRNDYQGEQGHHLQHSLLKASAIAVAMKKRAYAQRISAIVPSPRHDVWAFTDHFTNRSVSLQLIRAAVIAASGRQDVAMCDVLPSGLDLLVPRVSSGLTEEAFRNALKQELKKEAAVQQKLPLEKRIHAFNPQDELVYFIDNRLASVLEITRLLAELLGYSFGKTDGKFLEIVNLWFANRTKNVGYEARQFNSFFDVIGRQIIVFIIWARKDLNLNSVKSALEKLFQASAPTSLVVEVVAALARRPAFQQFAGATALKVKSLIEQEEDVDGRASLLADLSRAILPASNQEAAVYFRAGLEQMDAIGSGDYEFTNELLYFASTIKGNEISISDFHTLANICELNMGDADKLPWGILGRAFARTAGRRALAKLSRWNDRGKALFEYSLLPFLKALVEDGKMESTLATTLLHLAKPVELNDCGTPDFASALEQRSPTNLNELVSRLIESFESNHPEPRFARTRQELSVVAKRIFGDESKEGKYLAGRASHYEQVNEQDNQRVNYRSNSGYGALKKQRRKQARKRRALRAVSKKVDPLDEQSLARAIESVDNLDSSYELKREFFDSVRKKVPFGKQSEYLTLVAGTANLDIYPKLNELTRCKDLWGSSSAALEGVYRETAARLVRLHAPDLIAHDHFSSHIVAQIADLSGVAIAELAINAAELFAGTRPNLPAQIWLGLASTINKETKGAEGQAALHRLLNSGAAKLSSKVVDGPYKAGLYVDESEETTGASLIWQNLGSEWAGSRWRAAHTIRIAAQLGSWRVIENLIGRWRSVNAGSYQAGELKFYHLHAKLWMLIALARTAIDHPKELFKHKSFLKRVALGKDGVHLLLRHFAAAALLQSEKAFPNQLSKEEVSVLENVSASTFPPVRAEQQWGNSFYQARPSSLPEPIDDFHADHDFEKHEITSVANAFGKTHWEVCDAITRWVRTFDTNVKGMYDTGGREGTNRERYFSMNSEHHGYGQHLGWHGLYEVAGEFLKKFPTIISEYDDVRWQSWFSHQTLSHTGGLWLSDGLDRPPIETQSNLMEIGPTGVRLTSDQRKILSVVGIQNAIADGLVVCGDWQSADDIKVKISSALISVDESEKVAKRLAKLEPFHVSLPFFDDSDDPDSGSRRDEKKGVEWTIRPRTTTKLDQTDPWGSTSALDRPQFSQRIQTQLFLRPTDSFNRGWVDAKNNKVASADVSLRQNQPVSCG
jgi:hypothetical protein